MIQAMSRPWTNSRAKRELMFYVREARMRTDELFSESRYRKRICDIPISANIRLRCISSPLSSSPFRLVATLLFNFERPKRSGLKAPTSSAARKFQ